MNNSFGGFLTSDSDTDQPTQSKEQPQPQKTKRDKKKKSLSPAQLEEAELQRQPLPELWKKNHNWDPRRALDHQFIPAAGITYVMATGDDTYILLAAERRTENGIVLHPLGGKPQTKIESQWVTAFRETDEESHFFFGETGLNLKSQFLHLSWAVQAKGYLLFALEVNEKGKGEMSKLYGNLEQTPKIEFTKNSLASVTNSKCEAKLAPYPCYPYSYGITEDEIKDIPFSIASLPLHYDYKLNKGLQPAPMPIIGAPSVDIDAPESTLSPLPNTPTFDPKQFSQHVFESDRAVSYHWVSLKSLLTNTFQKIGDQWETIKTTGPPSKHYGHVYKYKYKPHQRQNEWQSYYDNFISNISGSGSYVNLSGLSTDEGRLAQKASTVEGLEMAQSDNINVSDTGHFIFVANTITGLEFPLSSLTVCCLCTPGGILDRYAHRFIPTNEKSENVTTSLPTVSIASNISPSANMINLEIQHQNHDDLSPNKPSMETKA